MDEEMLMRALMVIAENPQKLNGMPSMPNVNTKTMGGKQFWNNIASYKGWRIQQNTITHHCRILDPKNVRRAWGGMEAMEKIFRKLAENN